MIETTRDALTDAFGGAPLEATDLELWPYCWAKFGIEVDDRRVEFEVSPADSSAEIRISVRDKLLAGIVLDDVRLIKTERLHGTTALRIFFRRKDEVLHLQLTPSPLLLWPASQPE